mmetsp:Transcript_96789/g.216870  ORF Transcript_96789/g.216870 Transcript_96789/m.216870 type:complete len:240 (-) Transcript_96789:128-847(-)
MPVLFTSSGLTQLAMDDLVEWCGSVLKFGGRGKPTLMITVVLDAIDKDKLSDGGEFEQWLQWTMQDIDQIMAMCTQKRMTPMMMLIDVKHNVHEWGNNALGPKLCQSFQDAAMKIIHTKDGDQDVGRLYDFLGKSHLVWVCGGEPLSLAESIQIRPEFWDKVCARVREGTCCYAGRSAGTILGGSAVHSRYMTRVGIPDHHGLGLIRLKIYCHTEDDDEGDCDGIKIMDGEYRFLERVS